MKEPAPPILYDKYMVESEPMRVVSAPISFEHRGDWSGALKKQQTYEPDETYDPYIYSSINAFCSVVGNGELLDSLGIRTTTLNGAIEVDTTLSGTYRVRILWTVRFEADGTSVEVYGCFNGVTGHETSFTIGNNMYDSVAEAALQVRRLLSDGSSVGSLTWLQNIRAHLPDGFRLVEYEPHPNRTARTGALYYNLLGDGYEPLAGFNITPDRKLFNVQVSSVFGDGSAYAWMDIAAFELMVRRVVETCADYRKKVIEGIV